jgi:LmbE family N-acetylglucosaminyl deacetylase
MSATVRAHVRRDQRVLVASLFTHAGPRDAGPFLRHDYPRRRAEDEAACRLLGASVLHGGLPDAPFRAAAYRDLAGLCFARQKRESADQRRADTLVRQIVAAARPRRIYAPLGVGEHVDHRLTHNAARALGHGDVWYYEDRPYAFVRHAVALRLETLGLGRFKTEWYDELAESFQAAPMTAGLDPAVVHEVAMCFGLLHCGAPRARKSPARPFTRTFSAEASRFAQKVFECHRSQVQGIVGGPGRYAPLARAYARQLKRAGYIERFWRI